MILEDLNRMRVRTYSPNGLIVDVRELMEDSGNVVLWCTRSIQRWIDRVVLFEDEVEARIFVKSFLYYLYKNGYEYTEEVFENATEYTKQFLSDSSWSFLKGSKKVNIPVKETNIGDIQVQVAVNTNGKIKKGGKQVLAAELFKTHILNNAEPMSNKEFVELLMKELDMTKLGANTYLFNLRKEHGMVNSRK